MIAGKDTPDPPAGADQPDGRRRPAVMTDVAKAAGVSHQTVSRVLKGTGKVSPETRQRVRAAIEALDYQINSTARALATGRRYVVGVVGFDTSLHGPASLLTGIERAARLEGYALAIASLEAHNRESLGRAIDHLRRTHVDGILAIAPPPASADILLKLADEVSVVVFEGHDNPKLPVIGVDHASGATRATRHLLDLGHETVWHVAGPRDRLGAAQSRERAWRESLLAAGCPVPPVLYGDWSARSGYEHGRVLAATPGVTAVFAGNDQMALGVIAALQEAGRRIPDDVSIVGFDDMAEAAFFTPALTSVRQDFAEFGRIAFAKLLDHMNGYPMELSSRHILPPLDLIVRNSTAVAPGLRAGR